MRVAVAQIEPMLGDRERNLESALAQMREAASAGAELLVLPECALSGYMFADAAEALPFAEQIPGPATEALASECRLLAQYVVRGLLEPTYLPFLGVDRFVVAGDELPVFDTPIGRIGIEICYDLRFPEVTRALTLRGAEIVAHPTNFPIAARSQTDVITVARALENRIYLLSANRVGKERDGEFCGRSQIVDPYGVRLAEAADTGEALLVAEVDLTKARDKDYVIPGEYELYLLGDRRPELYRALVEENRTVRN